MAHPVSCAVGLAVLGLVGWAPAAAADTVERPAVAPLSAAAPIRPGPTFQVAQIADDGLLAAVAGKADVQQIDQEANVQNSSTVSGNTINGDFSTGTIAIGGTSFDGFNGLALFNVNTGNNVAINASMTVNVAIQQ